MSNSSNTLATDVRPLTLKELGDKIFAAREIIDSLLGETTDKVKEQNSLIDTATKYFDEKELVFKTLLYSDLGASDRTSKLHSVRAEMREALEYIEVLSRKRNAYIAEMDSEVSYFKKQISLWEAEERLAVE